MHIMSLYEKFRSEGYNFFVGVPCSHLQPFLDDMAKEGLHTFIPANKEDVALALASGAYMAGKKPLVYLQNSGLGHVVNLITSLLKPYQFSVHLLISLRKQPFEHEFMGKITRELLRILEYENHVTIIE